MFRKVYFWFRFYSFFKHINGIKQFAEKSMDSLIKRVTKNLSNFEEKKEKLNTEKESLIAIRNDITEKPILETDEYSNIKKRIRYDTSIVMAIIIAEMFLNYISTLIFITGVGFTFMLLRWFIAIVLTGGAIMVSEKLIESILPIQHYKKEKKDPISFPKIILWSFLLICVEVAIIGVSEARARDIEGGRTGGVLYYGFIILSMVLPIIAGAVRWDSAHYLDIYKNTQLYYRIRERITKIDSILRQNEEKGSDYYKIQTTVYWDILNEFRTYKENYNLRKNIDEDLTNHFARDNEAFQKEADKRYFTNVRERKSSRISKLTVTDIEPGNKLGQTGIIN